MRLFNIIILLGLASIVNSQTIEVNQRGQLHGGVSLDKQKALLHLGHYSGDKGHSSATLVMTKAPYTYWIYPSNFNHYKDDNLGSIENGRISHRWSLGELSLGARFDCCLDSVKLQVHEFKGPFNSIWEDANHFSNDHVEVLLDNPKPRKLKSGLDVILLDIVDINFKDYLRCCGAPLMNYNNELCGIVYGTHDDKIAVISLKQLHLDKILNKFDGWKFQRQLREKERKKYNYNLDISISDF